jgi:hypothetical protein
VLHGPPEDFVNHYNGQWRAWYASAWAEAAVIAGLPEAVDRLERARLLTVDNPVAQAVVLRAAALLESGEERQRGLEAAATTLHASGARYQWARTLVMLGGDHRERGEDDLAALGAAAMPWPR